MLMRFGIAVGVALAATTSVQAQGNKPVRTGTYYEDRASKSISGLSVSLTFAQTPTDKFFNIARIYCLAGLTNPNVLVATSIVIGTTSGSADTGRSFYFDFAGSGNVESGYRFYTFSPQVLIKVGPGRYPTIQLSGTGSNGNPFIQGDCTITGDLSDN